VVLILGGTSSSQINLLISIKINANAICYVSLRGGLAPGQSLKRLESYSWGDRRASLAMTK
jgi:hypothetical protein